MPALVVLGLQWGDEGKGRIIHSFSRNSHYVARYQGGNNAGHTLVLGKGETLALHLVPSGIVYPKVQCLIGNGVVVDIRSLKEELETLSARGIKYKNRLWVSGLSHVILPYHIRMDKYLESQKGKIGTTQRGIGPAYKDKVARVGVRVLDYLEGKTFEELVAHNMREKLAPILEPAAYRSLEKEIIADARHLRTFLTPLVADVSKILHEALQHRKRVILESAQGSFLDVDFGTYPYVTSSNPTASFAPCGVGLGPRSVDQVLGVAKLFTTRVGEGPFPTECNDAWGSQVREKGGEYGATTGRPRRIGFLDLTMLKKSVRINGVDRLALTKLDTLSGMGPFKVCVGYRWQGKTLTEFPDERAALQQAEPIYKNFSGFSEDVSRVTQYKDLPASAKKLIELTCEFSGAPAAMVSVGRQAGNQIILDKKFVKDWL